MNSFSRTYSSNAIEYFQFDSESLLSFCGKIQDIRTHQSKSLLEIKLVNLESIWNTLYESFRAVLISKDDLVTPKLKNEVRETFESCTEAYYKSSAHILDLKKRLDNPVNLRFQTTYNSYTHPSPPFENINRSQMRIEKPIKRAKITQCSETHNTRNDSQQFCLSDELPGTASEKDAENSVENTIALENPTNSQNSKATTALSLITHEPIISGLSSAAAQTAMSQFVGRRDLPQRVENIVIGNIPKIFKPLEDKSPSRPSSTTTDISTNNTTQSSITFSMSVLSLNPPQHDVTNKPEITQWKNPQMIYIRFILRWHNYLKYLPKHRKLKKKNVMNYWRLDMIEARMEA